MFWRTSDVSSAAALLITTRAMAALPTMTWSIAARFSQKLLGLKIAGPCIFHLSTSIVYEEDSVQVIRELHVLSEKRRNLMFQNIKPIVPKQHVPY
ncbi:hypothetical protein LINGRAHAP2_LOCUS31047 [Linum grandiflorum]